MQLAHGQKQFTPTLKTVDGKNNTTAINIFDEIIVILFLFIHSFN